MFVSIPLEQGSVFRHNRIVVKEIETVSIPLEQGSVFRRKNRGELGWNWTVSIPLEQGSVFRQINLSVG